MGSLVARTMAAGGRLLRSGCPRSETRPTAVFFVPTGALLAHIVEQSLRYVLPDRVAAIKSGRHRRTRSTVRSQRRQERATHGVGSPLAFVVASERCRRARILEQRVPVFGRKRFVWSFSGDRRFSGGFGGQFLHLFGRRHAQLAVDRWNHGGMPRAGPELQGYDA